jgi:tetratricopeptide (TPR) repeat protein/cold shock CspA family protein
VADHPLGVLLPRVALYSILSAIEEDLRLMLSRNIGALTPAEALDAQLAARTCERALRDLGDEATKLTELLPYLDFADAWELVGRQSGALPPAWVTFCKTHTKRIQALAPIRNRVMHTRPLEFDDLPAVTEFAELLRSETTLETARLTEALDLLERSPEAVLSNGVPALDEPEAHNLPFPDFDETGFIGRRAALDEIKAACLGAYPVVTIVGDGGFGKTAAALKVAYELLDDPNSPFEATIWSTSKTTQLTAQDVVRIDGAISTSLGLMTAVASELGGVANDPVEEVLEYLGQFRILLILDNLETVLDDRIAGFLRRLPSGSKVLITSRIGLKSLEYPVHLPKLTESEAVQLLRAVARVRGLESLVQIDNKRLAAYCSRMNNNPLWMKWFVSGVQAGVRPEDLLANPKTFLDFSMSNVYDHLSDVSRQVLQTLQVSKGRKSQAELAFLTSLEVEPLQDALGQLCASNMVTMASTPTGSSYETHYQLGELAKTYLAKRHPVEKTLHQRVTRRDRELRAAGQELREAQKLNPYQLRSLDLRTSGHLIVARYLLDALSHGRNGAISQAESALANAKRLAPEWYEVHRVEGVIQTQAGNLTGAQDAFECAIELEPNSAPLRLRYGMFKLDHMDDPDGAIAELKAALNIDPESYDCKLEMTRALQRNLDFEASRRLLNELFGDQNRLPQFRLRMLYDLELQHWYRVAEKFAAERDHDRASRALMSLARSFQQCPNKLRDAKIRGRLQHALPVAMRVRKYAYDTEVVVRLDTFIRWIDSGNWARTEAAGDEGDDERARGIVVKIVSEKGYGFIRLRDGDELFFHYSDLQFPEAHVSTGISVMFEIDEGKNGGSRAVRISRADPALAS